MDLDAGAGRGAAITVYFSERDRHGDRLLVDAILDAFQRHQIQTSVVLRGVEGFGQRNRLRTDRVLTSSENLPAVAIAIDSRDRVERALPVVLGVVGWHGMVTIEPVRLLGLRELEGLASAEDPDHAATVTLYGSASATTWSRASRAAAIDELRRSGAAVASVQTPVDGSLRGCRQRGRFFGRDTAMALMLQVVGDLACIRSALSPLAGLLDDPLVTVAPIKICKSGGTHLSDVRDQGPNDGSGLPVWRKLTIHVESQAQLQGRQLYRQLIRRLSVSGAAGATVLRAAGGFAGDRPPMTLRWLRLDRQVPVQAIVIDSPANMNRLWPIVDDLTREVGVVTSESVPVSRAFAAATPARSDNSP